MARRLIVSLLLLAPFALAQDAPAPAQGNPAPSAPEPAAPKPVTADDRLYDEVRNVLAYDYEVRGAAIDVQVKNGLVTLTGRVRNEKAREKATKIVKKVKGVTEVKNELKLFTDK